MNPLVLFCKTYDQDMFRARRLVRSIQSFNTDQLPVYLSVPEKSLQQFKECFKGIPCHFVTDESILAATVSVYGNPPSSFPKHLFQQLIKLEFWRLNICQNYLWLDSDSYFIKPFNTADFLHSSGVPYLVQHDCSDLLDFAKKAGMKRVISDYHETRQNMKKLFQRTGPDYDFGPSPVVWSVKVLEDIYSGYLKSQKKTIFSLLTSFPCEILLYGEFVHKRNKIPIYPAKPFFKVYHYIEQFLEDETHGVAVEDIAANYLGIVMQSNWAKVAKRESLQQKLQRKIKNFGNPFVRKP
jgi:hypothetical protein